MQKNGAIELSVNMLVVIILSIVVLVGGMAFVYNLLHDLEKTQEELDSRTEAEIQRLLIDQGKAVALPYYSKTIERKDNGVYGIGIRNVFEEAKSFHVSVEFDKAVTSTNEIVELELDPLDWLLYDTDSLELDAGTFEIVSIHVAVPGEAPKAQYLFRVRVTVDGEPHGNVQQFVVIVP